MAWPKGKPRPTGAGRKKGVPNKATADIRALAQEHGTEALNILRDIAKNGESDAARVAAARDILDRAYGKPRQTIDANVKRSLSDMTEDDLAVLAGINPDEEHER
ncbi:hypothetical protein [Saccharibacter floricola]|uniref:DUF5681 domain-containing protein n=1 Tax=Saccharibacter floricola DSM 15669 TaxID=1123227 RepID=A0ABQ0P1A6_9PROT|nr:hypothetical protein [Saccharibacter floricola]GBQ08452.1 hypothetical protein AA15669_1790 [Saccharibacter floricola DSM 15669]